MSFSPITDFFHTSFRRLKKVLRFCLLPQPLNFKKGLLEGLDTVGFIVHRDFGPGIGHLNSSTSFM